MARKSEREVAIDAQLEELRLEEMRARGTVIPSTATPLELDGDFGEIGEGSGIVAHDEGRDRVTVYSTVDGRPSVVLVSMLAKTLMKTLPGGAKAFSLDAPEEAYAGGSTRCLLHPEHEERATWDEPAIGLAGITCGKGNLRSQFDLRLHMEHRHKIEWGVIQERRERLEKERREERELALQEAMIAAVKTA
jgi:hypothetical protein